MWNVIKRKVEDINCNLWSVSLYEAVNIELNVFSKYHHYRVKLYDKQFLCIFKCCLYWLNGSRMGSSFKYFYA